MRKTDWDAVAFDPQTGEVDPKQTAEDREAMGENVLPVNPPPGPKWRARKGFNKLQLSGALRDFMECLIDRASKNTGGCWPSLEFIAGWTGRPYTTIKSAAKEARRLRLAHIIERGRNIKGQERSNAYAINWTILFAACQSIERFERANAARNKDMWGKSGDEISSQTPQNQGRNFAPAREEFSSPNLGIGTTEVSKNHGTVSGPPSGAPHAENRMYFLATDGSVRPNPKYRRQA